MSPASESCGQQGFVSCFQEENLGNWVKELCIWLERRRRMVWEKKWGGTLKREEEREKVESRLIRRIIPLRCREREMERDHEFWHVRFRRRSCSQNGRQNRADQMWESYKEQEEFGKDVLKQFQNHLSKIPLPVPDDALAPAAATRTGAAANSRWGSNGYWANSKELNGDGLPDLLQQSRSDATAPNKRSRADRPSNNGTGLSSLETDCLELEPLPSEKEMMTSNSCTEISNEFDLSKRETIQETRELKDPGAE